MNHRNTVPVHESGAQQSSTSQPPLLTGYLKKLGERGIKTYKRRYFRQTGFRVSYYESESARPDHSKGFINLEQIQEVRKSTGHSNAFELVSKENKRTYVLQVCEPGETVEAWIARVQQWLTYIKETVWARAQSTVGSATSGTGSSIKLTSDLLKLSSYTQVESTTSNVDVLSNYPEETWADVLRRTEAENALQLETINTLRAEVEELNQQFKQMANSKATAIEKTKAELQEEIRLFEKLVEESQRSLLDADQSLIVKERQVMALEKQLSDSTARVELTEALLKAAKENLTTANQTITLQEESLKKLTENQENEPTPPIPTGLGADLKNLKRMWAANAEQQTLNENATRHLARLDASLKAHEAVESNAISKLKKAIELHEQALTTVRKELVEAQQTDLATIAEFEHLRQSYFVSLTICIKLQGEVTGRKPAVDLSDLDALYQVALEQKPDHLEWNYWLAERLFPGTPQSVILGRRREPLGSAPSSGVYSGKLQSAPGSAALSGKIKPSQAPASAAATSSGSGVQDKFSLGLS